MTHDQEVIYGKVYQRTSGSSVLKYLGEEGDFADKWNAWADSVGAERGTVEDMLSIGDEDPLGNETADACREFFGNEEDDEVMEMPEGPWNEEEDPEDLRSSIS
jgi:hypothetical protein